MKRIVLCLLLLSSGIAFAIPTISVQDLTVEKEVQVDPTDPTVMKTIVKTMPKFTSDIRGSLIKSGQFKVINVRTLADNLAYAHDIDVESPILIPESGVKAESSTKVESSIQIESGIPESATTPLLKQQAVNPATEYYLVGVINYIGENEDSHPIKSTNNMTKQYVVEVTADFKLIRAKDKAIMASFSASGRSNDVRIISSENLQNTAWHHNVGKLVSETSKDLASNVLTEMQTQFNFTIQNEEKDRKANEPVVVTDVKEYK